MLTNQTFKFKECHEAAKAGDLNELKNMHENGCEWDILTPAWAASNGHLECLKYAHENGCPWDNYTTENAAFNGHLECLKYAHENGCPWDRMTPYYAAKYGHLECFKYCFEEWNNPQEFWNHDYNLTQIIYKIDLDHPVWRRLFNLDLSNNYALKEYVEDKKKEIEEIKEASKDALQNRLPMDVIKYCLQPFF